jgi:hypothetical protein
VPPSCRRAFPLALLTLLLLVPAASAATPDDLPPGTQRLTLKYGPFTIAPGQNTIDIDGRIPQPKVDGYITRFRPDLIRADGSVPPVDVLHLHHGVWLNNSAGSSSTPFGEIWAAAGEEKTIVSLPEGYGYPYKRTDKWALNHMIHNLTSTRERVYLVYELDFIPKSSKAAKGMIPARPVFMDVERGKSYPVFDVKRGAGENGAFTYPDEQPDAYRGAPRNEWTADRSGVLISTGGHLHPGGQHTDLWVRRDGDLRHLFRSEAKYFEPAGAVSWDVSMTVTPPNWAVKVKKGDKLSISATYDSRRASWYEAMGIMVVYMADKGPGKDPFTERVPRRGKISHGHLAENDNHGGEQTGLPDPLQLNNGPAMSEVGLQDFLYQQGDFSLDGSQLAPPTVRQGQSLRFVNREPDRTLMHSITACKPPCNKSIGIAYPLADGAADFDSGNLGFGPPGFTAAANRDSWETPKDLPPATYTYFCRVHPFMRGAFRVVE